MGLAKVGSKLELSNPQFHINVTAIFSHPTAPHYIVQVLFSWVGATHDMVGF